jgi:hypothetical protein
MLLCFAELRLLEIRRLRRVTVLVGLGLRLLAEWLEAFNLL